MAFDQLFAWLNTDGAAAYCYIPHHNIV